MRRRRRFIAATAGLVLLGAGCAGDLERDQAAIEARTCASYLERIAARDLADGDFDPDVDPEKAPTSPVALRDDPDLFYDTFEDRLQPERFSDRNDAEAGGSSVQRLLQRCRALGR